MHALVKLHGQQFRRSFIVLTSRIVEQEI